MRTTDRLRDLVARLREEVRLRIRAIQIPAELPRTMGELASLLKGAWRAIWGRPPVGARPGEPPVGARPGEPPVGARPGEPPVGARPGEPPVGARPGEPRAPREQQPPAAPPPESADLDAGLPPLPERYADNRLVLLPRDPNSLFAYWDLAEPSNVRIGLRLHDVTGLPDGALAREPYVQPVTDLAGQAYLPARPGHTYVLEIGHWGADGAFVRRALTEPVATPPASASRLRLEVFATAPAPSAAPEIELPPPHALREPAAASPHAAPTSPS